MKRMIAMMLLVCVALSLVMLAGCNEQIPSATTGNTPLGTLPEETVPTEETVPSEPNAQQTAETVTYPPATVPTAGTTYPPATVPTVGTTYPSATAPSFTDRTTASTQMPQTASTTAETSVTETAAQQTTQQSVPSWTSPITTTTAQAVPTQTTATTAEAPIVVPPVGGSIDFGGRTFTILCSENSVWANWDTINEIYANEKTDKISLSLDKRNKEIETQYNCKLEFVTSQTPSYIVVADKIANRDTVDLFAETVFYQQNMLIGDAYYNLYSLDIDLGASYFNRTWVDTFTIRTAEKGNTLYSVIGDFSFGELMDANVIFYNKALFASKFPNTDLEALVKNGNWTFDTMMAFAKEVAMDVDGQGWDAGSSEDIYGLHYHGAYPFFAASGMTFVKNTDGTLWFDLNGKDAFSSAIDEILEILGTDGVRSHALWVESEEYIDGGRTLFATGTIAAADEYHLEDDLCVLPYPKMTAEQRYYTTTLANSYPFAYAIPSTVEDIDTAASFFEVYAKHSETTVKPVLYEVYGEKYGSSDMIALIEESLIFDPAYFYWNGDIVDPIMDHVLSGKNTVATYFDRIGSKRFDEGYEKLLNAINENEY